MDELKLDLENCYGIRRLEHTFNFRDCQAAALYAPNGAMKSSLAKTFQDIADGKKSSDRMFPDRTTKRVVVDESSAELDPESILVVRPYDEEFGPSANTSTLLVNAALRKDYEKLNAGVEDAKKAFLAAMKEQSGSKRDLAAEISATFTRTEDQFLTAVIRINDEIKIQSDAQFADIPYDLVFDPKVVEMLEKEQVQEALEDYVVRFNELIDQSTYFKRGTFTYYNAGEIAKALESNGFFGAAHSVRLNADRHVEITTKQQLEDLVKAEKEGIAADAKLRKTFEAVEKLLHRNVSVRDFNAFISNREDIVPALSNIGNFKEQVWKSYIVKHRDAYDRLVQEVRDAADKRKQIEEAARNERTAWQEVIEIFNSRFFVPFELSVQNLTSAVLEGEIPKLGFTFREGEDRRDVDKNALLEVLSTGERKALYILNIIFEVQVRIKSGQKTLMIVDDVADSFDYKNKYAIIQYLKDISEEENFRQVILTHNFDFFRTLESRFVRRDSCFMVAKKEGGIEVSQAVGIRNIFVNDWKVHFGTAPRKRIASIPFMRNLVEFTKGKQDPDYIALTALLHVKPNTETITDAELFEFYSRIFGAAARNATPTAGTALELIYQEADACLAEADGANFENKIVLSIATRLRAEQYMIGRICDPEALAGIRGMQTTALLRCFKGRFPEDDATSVMDSVVLMTPENIHLNSFMYEPILDMSDEHLRRIYEQVKAL
ncbi:AAA domain-containing protein [Rhodobacter sp. JA431]|uniref:AAA family ATPase n=1 Tax=Rhodobacter sp. JA431 TaxID=570013 RepID=UPI000BCE1E3C|nr:AAA family ATPase [Rhodobacter sp. JA431]SOC21725.1 AAA domain-containing protein [Rhodobacter sp. JA431]